MVEFIKNLIGNDSLATLLMSLIPFIELKGGIVFALGAGIKLIKAFFLSYFGSTLVFIPVFFLLVPILNLLKKIKWFNGLAVSVENYFKNKACETLGKRKNKEEKRSLSENSLKALGVFIFVAIPLPMTGVWTGTAVAVFLGLKFKDAILPVTLGNFIAGCIISALAEFCLAVWTIESLNYLLWGLFALAIVLLVITVIKISVSKDKSVKDEK